MDDLHEIEKQVFSLEKELAEIVNSKVKAAGSQNQLSYKLYGNKNTLVNQLKRVNKGNIYVALKLLKKIKEKENS